MENSGYIEIRVSGAKGNLPITPDNYDIREIIPILENAEALLFPTNKKDRPTISYKSEEGSVRHLLFTSAQAVIGFNAVLGQIIETNNIDFLDQSTANALLVFQEMAQKRNYEFEIKTSIENSYQFKLDPATQLFRTAAVWADAEFYFYGKITNAGGKEKANIHINTEDYGNVIIQTPIKLLEKFNDNILYRSYGIRAVGKQNAQTGEPDLSSFSFIELIDYQPKYDEAYLLSLRNKAKNSWLGNIDADEWLRKMRGGFDA